MLHATTGDTAKAVALERISLATGDTVGYRVKLRDGDTLESGAATIQDRTGAVVTFPVPDAAGRYDVEFEVTYADDSVETVPSVQADVLLVREAVG